jgi:hypothetical protein
LFDSIHNLALCFLIARHRGSGAIALTPGSIILDVERLRELMPIGTRAFG